MTFKIEKNVPLPETTEYPFASMQIGDSFQGLPEQREATQSAAWYWQKKLKMEFTFRITSRGFRCWRKS